MPRCTPHVCPSMKGAVCRDFAQLNACMHAHNELVIGCAISINIPTYKMHVKMCEFAFKCFFNTMDHGPKQTKSNW